MKLLIVTQRVDANDQLLGFFIEWIRGLSEYFEKIVVLCLEKGEFELPAHVEVISLGKDRGHTKFTQLASFYGNIFISDYDAVFVHMNPVWVVLGGWYWRIMGKKISMWYAHKSVTMKLKIAERFSDIIFTSTPEGFRIQSDKVRVIGQGINTELFTPDFRNKPVTFKVVTVGRLSPAKDYETLIRAVEILRDGKFEVEIAGSPVLDGDRAYAGHLKKLISAKGLEGKVSFIGSIPNNHLAEYLYSASLFVNMGLTGSLDKAILEAMSAGLIVLTCNEALEAVLGRYASTLMYPKKDHEALAARIRSVLEMSEDNRKTVAVDLRNIVVHNHNLIKLIERIASELRFNGRI